MIRFDTQIQYLKYQVLKEVAKEAFNDTLTENVLNIPKQIIPGKTPTMRCCVYKERAILAERVKLAMGGNKNDPNIIEVIDIACDECPIGGYEVTPTCRGCLAHHCHEACPKDAIYFDANHQAHIDKTKCVNCGACAKACPYTAIVSRKRPCVNACPVKAINTKEDEPSTIDSNKCINCGACISSCPFGAIMDKSFILDAIKFIKESENNTKYKTIAIVAPAIADQYKDLKLGQVIAGVKALGFADVYEVAVGADMVAFAESQELIEKGSVLSSCCPAFVKYVKTNFPKMADSISHNLSPAGAIAAYLKKNIPDCKIVFVGPCTAKKAEVRLESVKPYIDCAITFEELNALFDSRDIVLADLEERAFDDASYFGRVFARSGGLTEAMAQGLKEHGSDLELKPLVCSGIEECKLALLKKNRNLIDANFIEGMACIGGCIGGAGVLVHRTMNKNNIDKYGKESVKETIGEAISTVKECE